MDGIIIRTIQPSDEELVASLMTKLWGSRTVISRGRAHDAARLPGCIAHEGERVVGLVTLCFSEDGCEVVTLDALEQGKGIGTELLVKAQELARSHGCGRLWLITTNDNLDALRFYQRRGFRIVSVYPDAVTEARKLKPQIPLQASNGIPIRDEIELERQVALTTSA